MGWGALWKRGKGRRSRGELGSGCFGRLMGKWVRAQVRSGSQPLWLKESMGVFGDWGVPSSAPLTLGRSLWEDWAELCGFEPLAQLWLFGCSVLRVPGSMWVLPDMDMCPHHRAKLVSADRAKGHLCTWSWAKAGGETASHPKGCSLGKHSILGAVLHPESCALVVLECKGL